jgi:chromosome segregation ATPase
MCASKKTLSALLLAATFAVTPALAAEKKADPNKGEVRRLQQMQRQLEREKVELAEQKAAAESELGDVRKKVDGESRRAAALSRDVGALRAARDATAAKLAETEAELRKTQEAQRAAEAEGKRLQAALAAEKQQLQVCTEQGQELRKVGNQVLDLYEKKSCLDSSLQGEPFTGLKRVEIENAVEDMREKLDSQRVGS